MQSRTIYTHAQSRELDKLISKAKQLPHTWTKCCPVCKHIWRKARGRTKKQLEGGRGRRVRWMTLRDMSISLCLKAIPKVLKILIL